MLREYSRLGLHLDGLQRFSRAPSQLGVHNDASSTAFNPFEYGHGSARWRFGEWPVGSWLAAGTPHQSPCRRWRARPPGTDSRAWRARRQPRSMRGRL